MNSPGGIKNVTFKGACGRKPDFQAEDDLSEYQEKDLMGKPASDATIYQNTDFVLSMHIRAKE